jgi:predicted DNA-binding transcriptional regulator AlpA
VKETSFEKRMLGVKDLAEYLGIKPQTIYNQVPAGTFPIKRKAIPGLRRLKWDRRDVDRYLDKLPSIN